MTIYANYLQKRIVIVAVATEEANACGQSQVLKFTGPGAGEGNGCIVGSSLPLLLRVQHCPKADTPSSPLIICHDIWLHRPAQVSVLHS